MSGIYIHIPYCRKACHYCDFHFSTTLSSKAQMIGAMKKEIEMQKNFFEDTHQKALINSIYFGGGTPSLLQIEELKDLMDTLHQYFQIDQHAEITLEANPDDLNPFKLQELLEASINRLSIGVQSFYQPHLKEMNRAHDVSMALKSIEDARRIGFSNISVDLIYGIPDQSNTMWAENLDMVFKLDIPHLSCYSLTVEPGTALAHFIRKGSRKDVDEEMAASHFHMLMKQAAENGYEQYEISNFCKNGMYSKHNSNYWKAEKFLGIGPSAHSFNGLYRQSNVSNNQQYIKSISEGKLPHTIENLTENEKYNEYLMVSLRTIWGCSFQYVEKNFGTKVLLDLEKSAQRFLQMGLIHINQGNVVLTTKGKLMADYVSRELFRTD